MKTEYTVQRITKADKFFGPVHGLNKGSKTLCGRQIDENWYILTVNYDGEVTCKKCLEKANES